MYILIGLGVIIFGLIFMGVYFSLYGVRLYNNLVTLKNLVSKAWAGIDVLLKQRHDELPKLVECCKAYMGHENKTLTAVMQARAGVNAARASGDTKALGQAETQMHAAVGAIFATVENYPKLKANENFKELQGRITDLEENI